MAKKEIDFSNRGHLNDMVNGDTGQVIDRMRKEKGFLDVAEMAGYPLIVSMSDEEIGKETVDNFEKEGKFIYTYRASELPEINVAGEYNTLVGVKINMMNERVIDFHVASETALEAIYFDKVREDESKIAKKKARYIETAGKALAREREDRYLTQTMNSAYRFRSSEDFTIFYESLGVEFAAPADVTKFTAVELDEFLQAMAIHATNIGYEGTPVWMINAHTKILCNQLMADKVQLFNREGEEIVADNANVFSIHGQVLIYAPVMENVNKVFKQSGTSMFIAMPGTVVEDFAYVVPVAERPIDIVGSTAGIKNAQMGESVAYGGTFTMPIVIKDNYSDSLTDLYYIVATSDSWEQNTELVHKGMVQGEAPSLNPVVNRTIRGMADAVYNNAQGDETNPATYDGTSSGSNNNIQGMGAIGRMTITPTTIASTVSSNGSGLVEVFALTDLVTPVDSQAFSTAVNQEILNLSGLTASTDYIVKLTVLGDLVRTYDVSTPATGSIEVNTFSGEKVVVEETKKKTK